MVLPLLLSAALAQAPPPVVGGEETAAFPAVGVLRVEIAGQFLGLCSGTLIRPTWVLTAAHCTEEVQGWRDEGYAASFAIGERASDADEAADFLRLYQHEGYDPADLANDLALIELATPLQTTPAPENRAAPDDSWEDELLDLVGYGSTGTDLGDGGLKRWAALHYLDRDSAHVMAYDPWGQAAACHGDSGGALLRPDGSLAGVVSYIYDRKGETQTCEGSAVAGVRVDAYWWWIAETMGEADTGSASDGPGGGFPTGPRGGGCAGVLGLGLLSWLSLLARSTGGSTGRDRSPRSGSSTRC